MTRPTDLDLVAADAPSGAEWRGTMRGRGFVLSLQWADGKTPQEQLTESMAVRDAAVARAEAAEAEVARLRAEAREAAQVLIAETGAAGPMDVGAAALRAAGRISALTIDRDSLRAGVARLRVALDDVADALECGDSSRDGMLARVAGIAASFEALQAIVEGRTTAPTEAEYRAHHAADGSWLLRWADRTSSIARGLYAVADIASGGGLPVVLWIALDATGRPCAWPDVAKEGPRALRRG